MCQWLSMSVMCGLQLSLSYWLMMTIPFIPFFIHSLNYHSCHSHSRKADTFSLSIHSDWCKLFIHSILMIPFSWGNSLIFYSVSFIQPFYSGIDPDYSDIQSIRYSLFILFADRGWYSLTYSKFYYSDNLHLFILSSANKYSARKYQLMSIS